MFYSIDDMFKFEHYGVFDTDEEHAAKVRKVKQDLIHLANKGLKPSFYIDDVLHHNDLTYGSLTDEEYEEIMNL